jgi:uncharacterized protein YjbI with pentapeptide repeats
MANPEHLEILKQGVEVWNKWRKENRGVVPDLQAVDLIGANLERAYLSRARLSFANLSDASLSYASLNDADLHNANLSDADLSSAKLKRADLRSAVLYWADLSYANLSNSILEDAYFGKTILGDTDLTNVTGLDSCNHAKASIIDHQTLIKSGDLPLNFLQGCGLPDTLIGYIPSLLQDPIQFYSCFISYSSKDQDFAERLHADLQNRGVRCWFAPEDLKIGDRIRPRIDESIRVHDKLLLVLSETSVASQWVEQEVETALSREREPEGKTVLFPIRIDDAVMESKAGWPALLKNTRNIGDFTRWKEHDSYQKAFERLLRDLKAEA